MGFSFEKLTVWQDAIELTGSVHQLTLSFPKEELYVLTSQSDKEFNRFLGIALRSGIEVVSCLYIAKRRDIINEKTFLEYYQTIEKLIIKIQALRKTLRG